MRMKTVKALWRSLGMTFALATAACSSSATPPCLGDAGQNPSACPATWADARSRCTTPTACGSVGFQCGYPGAGDVLGNCQATAVLLCVATDGGSPQWLCAQ